MVKLIVLAVVLTLSAAIPEQSAEMEGCDQACYLVYYKSGFTSGYLRYKCCIDRNQRLGIPVQDSSLPASNMPVESMQAHLSCDQGCISSYQALGYSADISVKECCFNSKLRATRFATHLEAVSDASTVTPVPSSSTESDPKSPSTGSGSSVDTPQSSSEGENASDPNGGIYGAIILFSIVGFAIVCVVLRYKYPRFCIPFCRVCDLICLVFKK